jgi:hypothetical protein
MGEARVQWGSERAAPAFQQPYCWGAAVPWLPTLHRGAGAAMQQRRQYRILRLNGAELSTSDPYVYGRDILRNFTHPREALAISSICH